MADLISREALLRNARKLMDYDEAYGELYPFRINAVEVAAIKAAPAVDAVEVVRCKDCVYWTRVNKHTGKCPFLIGEHQYAGDNHYCSCGERREEDAVD